MYNNHMLLSCQFIIVYSIVKFQKRASQIILYCCEENFRSLYIFKVKSTSNKDFMAGRVSDPKGKHLPVKPPNILPFYEILFMRSHSGTETIPCPSVK